MAISTPSLLETKLAKFQGLLSWSHRHSLVIALVLSISVVVGQVLAKGIREPVFDALSYVAIAVELERTGTYTNGGATNDDVRPGMFFAPLYPAFLAAVAIVDTDLRDALICFDARGQGCPTDDLMSAVLVQAALGGLSAFLVFLTALYLLRSPTQAWSVLVITLASGIHSYYASYLLTENLAFFGFFLFMAALARSLDRRSFTHAVLLGLSLAIAAMSRPTYLYVLYLIGPVMLFWLRTANRESWTRSFGFVAVFGLSMLFALLPWLVRNYAQFDVVALTSGYASYILAQRLAYNFMTWAEWAVSFIFWLPDFGDTLARALFEPTLYQKLTYDPGSYYMQGNRAFMQQTQAAAGSEERHLSYLFHAHLIPNFGKHIAVTIPIALRGMWVGKYIGLVGFLLLIPCWRLLARQGLGGRFVIILLPPYFVLGLNAFVSVNVVRYNEPLIAVFAIAIVVCLFGLRQALLDQWMRKRSGL